MNYSIYLNYWSIDQEREKEKEKEKAKDSCVCYPRLHVFRIRISFIRQVCANTRGICCGFKKLLVHTCIHTYIWHENRTFNYNQPKLFRQLLVWQYLHNYQYFVRATLATLNANLNFSFFPDSVWIIFGSKFLSILLVVHCMKNFWI